MVAHVAVVAAVVIHLDDVAVVVAVAVVHLTVVVHLSVVVHITVVHLIAVAVQVHAHAAHVVHLTVVAIVAHVAVDTDDCLLKGLMIAWKRICMRQNFHQ